MGGQSVDVARCPAVSQVNMILSRYKIYQAIKKSRNSGKLASNDRFVRSMRGVRKSRNGILPEAMFCKRARFVLKEQEVMKEQMEGGMFTLQKKLRLKPAAI